MFPQYRKKCLISHYHQGETDNRENDSESDEKYDENDSFCILREFEGIRSIETRMFYEKDSKIRDLTTTILGDEEVFELFPKLVLFFEIIFGVYFLEVENIKK